LAAAYKKIDSSNPGDYLSKEYFPGADHQVEDRIREFELQLGFLGLNTVRAHLVESI
jgi:hypothetical protein